MITNALKGSVGAVLTIGTLSAAKVYGRSLRLDPDCRGSLWSRMNELVDASIVSINWESSRICYHNKIVTALSSKEFAASHSTQSTRIDHEDPTPLFFDNDTGSLRFCGSVRRLTDLDAREGIRRKVYTLPRRFRARYF